MEPDLKTNLKDIENLTNDFKSLLRNYFSTYIDGYIKKNHLKNKTVLYRRIQEKVNIGVSTLQDFINGKSIMTIESIIKLATFLEVDLKNIFNETFLPEYYSTNSKPLDEKFDLTKFLCTEYHFTDDEIQDVNTYINYIRRSKTNNLSNTSLKN